MEDSRIIELFEERSEKALSSTQEKYGRYCTTISMNILHSPQEAEECVNDTFLRAWNTIPPTKPNPLKTYLGMLVRRISLNRFEFLHAKKRYSGSMDVLLSELEEFLPTQNSVESQIEEGFLKDTLNLFLQDLDTDIRNVFVRRYWYAYSIEAIATQYGYSNEKVKSILFRTRKVLKEHLEKQEVFL